MYVAKTTDVITFSQDGVNIDRSIKISSIAGVSGVFVPGSATPGNQSNPSLPYNRQSKCSVEILLNDGSMVPFDAQDVNSPAGWNTGTQAGLNLAVSTINGWL